MEGCLPEDITIASVVVTRRSGMKKQPVFSGSALLLKDSSSKLGQLKGG